MKQSAAISLTWIANTEKYMMRDGKRWNGGVRYEEIEEDFNLEHCYNIARSFWRKKDRRSSFFSSFAYETFRSEQGSQKKQKQKHFTHTYTDKKRNAGISGMNWKINDSTLIQISDRPFFSFLLIFPLHLRLLLITHMRKGSRCFVS